MDTDPIGPGLITASEAARLLAISERHLRRLTRERQIAAVHLGRALRYRRAELDRYVTANERPAL